MTTPALSQPTSLYADGQVVQMRLSAVPGWPFLWLGGADADRFRGLENGDDFLNLVAEQDRSYVDAALHACLHSDDSVPRLISGFRLNETLDGSGEATLQVLRGQQDDQGNQVLHAYLLNRSSQDQTPSERRALELVDGATGDGIWDWNLTGDTVYYAPRWCEILGLPIGSESRPFTKIPGLFAPDELAHLCAELDRHLDRGEGLFEITLPAHRRDGKTLCLRIRAVAVRGIDGTPLRLVGSFADITTETEASERLSQLNALMKAQLDASPDGVLILDLGGHTLLFNDVYREMWGLDEDTARSNLAGGLFRISRAKMEDPDRFAIDVLRALGKGVGHSWREVEMMDGRVIEEQTRPLQSETGEHTGRIWFFRDVTARKIAERQLIFAANLFNRSPEAMALLTPDLHITQINKALLQRLGYDDTELVGCALTMVDSGHQSTEVYDAICDGLAETGSWEGEIWNRRKDGGLIAHKVSIAPAHEEDGPAWEYIAVFSDISETKQQLDALRQKAHHDPLTGLPNRALLSDIIPAQVAVAERQKCWLAVVMIDLDGFKPINDTHGHRVGDEVLCHVAHNLTEKMRDADRIFRLGGDEFVVSAMIAPEEENLEPLCTRILSAIAEPCRIDGIELSVGGSLGVALYPRHGRDVPDLLDAADKAMYQAKSCGKGCYRLVA